MPVFVIHGTKDEIVPFWNGEHLFLACPTRYRVVPYWCENAGHNDIESFADSGVQFFDKFASFLRLHVEAYEQHNIGVGRLDSAKGKRRRSSISRAR